ncbi:YceI family protein [Lunatimonas salinarum]|uniref:YceI family protein n=1 Tax=Lunatimonas salinarum TaxID=1774590 RepID=UPI001ADED7B3|nr:YceI family protein [Lunatimonas salinarum]
MKFQPILLLSIVLGLISLQLRAQNEYKIDGKPTLKVSGTSTLHDWDMISDQANGSAKITVSGGSVQAITAATLSMPAESIKSGKRPMDTNAYKALGTDKHKEIKFQLTEAKKQGDSWLIMGTLDLAGMKKPVTFESTLKTSGSKVTIHSSTSFKLTAFGIEPPTALLGSVKTGDDVTLTIEMTLAPIN